MLYIMIIHDIVHNVKTVAMHCGIAFWKIHTMLHETVPK